MEELKFSEHTLNPFNYNNMKSKVIAVMMSMFVFSPEDGGSLFLRNGGPSPYGLTTPKIAIEVCEIHLFYTCGLI